MNLRPILDKIIIKVDEPEEQTAGGIFIAKAQPDTIMEAEVMAVGPGNYDDRGNFIVPEVEVGARILVNPNVSDSYEISDVKYTTITEKDIVAVLQ